jgi:leucyl aminopeptidase
MNVETFHGSPSELRTDLLVLVHHPGARLYDLADEKIQPRLDEMAADFEAGRLEGEVLFEPRHREGVGALVVYSTTSEKSLGLWEGLKTFVARALRLAARSGRRKVTVALNGPDAAGLAGKAVEGGLLGTYTFERYKKEPRQRYQGMTLEIFGTDEEADRADVEGARLLALETNFARDLVNEPANVATPEFLAQTARQTAADLGLDCQVWDEQALEAQGFVGLWSVGRSAAHPPRLIRLAYVPPGDSPAHLVLLGKAVTFDTGGVCLKPADKMYQMKGDMSGGAAVLAAMKVIARRRPALRVTGLVVAAENTLDANAQRPGDILVYKNGKSVQVENTDAEGRLILADGLCLAGELGATHVVDIATLTGACARALGPSFAGIMGNDRRLIDALTRAGAAHGEACWKLPLPSEYKEMLKSPVADMTNIGGPYGGAITAALFLQEFVPEGARWAHLDIAGTFWREKPWRYFEEGPTGWGTRTLAELACNWNEYCPQQDAVHP